MRHRSVSVLHGIVATLLALCILFAAAIDVRAQAPVPPRVTVPPQATVLPPAPVPPRAGALNSEYQLLVNAAAFSPDGRRIVAGGTGQVLRLWDVVWGIPVHAFYGHQSDII